MDFKFKTTKGTEVKMKYEPSGSVKVSDSKAFEGYLKKVVDFVEVDGKLEGKRVLPEEKTTKKGKKTEDKPKVELPKPKQLEIEGVDNNG